MRPEQLVYYDAIMQMPSLRSETGEIMKTRRQSCTLVSAAAAVTILAGLLLGQGDPVRANEAAIRLNIARAKAIDR